MDNYGGGGPHSTTPFWSSDHHHRNHHHHHNDHSIGGGENGGGSAAHSFPPPPRKRPFTSGDCDLVKLFVGCIPRTVTQHEMRSLFGEHGNVNEVVILRDKRTGLQQQCCFVKYATFEEADRAIAALNGQYTFPGEMHPIRVRYADGERGHPGGGVETYVLDKLYIGGMNKDATKWDIEQIFSPYGHIDDIYIARDERHQSRGKGFAFVRFSDRDMAISAINALNGTYVMRGCDLPLIVRFAEPKKHKTRESRPVTNANDHLDRNGKSNASHQVLPTMVPVGHASVDMPDPLDCEWSEHICPDGHCYYYNCVTCESRWEKPDEYSFYEQQLEKRLQQGHPECQKVPSMSCSLVSSTEDVSQMQRVQLQTQPCNQQTQDISLAAQELQHEHVQASAGSVVDPICS